jgi:DinB superfamily
MNPYALHLGDANARDVIAATAARLAACAGRLGGNGLHRSPAPGKWSAASILCHLADCETVFAYRLRQSLAEPYHVIQPFDQDAWAVHYEDRDPHAALALFSATRDWNIALIASMTPADLSRKLTHPERGEMTIQTVVETMAGHDLNHLAQLERIA